MISVGNRGPMVLVPLVLRGQPFGTLTVSNPIAGAAFDDEAVRLAETFADQASVALAYGRAQAELNRLSLLDERERIGRELHDGVIQSLFSVGMGLQATAVRSRDPEIETQREPPAGAARASPLVRLSPSSASTRGRRPVESAFIEMAKKPSWRMTTTGGGSTRRPPRSASGCGISRTGGLPLVGGSTLKARPERARPSRSPFPSDVPLISGPAALIGIARLGQHEAAMQAHVGPYTLIPLRIMIVDDHEVVRDGIKALLAEEEGPTIAGEAGGVREAIERVEWVRPDVVVMDIRLPDGSGIDATREIRARFPNTQVLMLTTFADDEALFASIMAGAAGYVLKQVKGGDLVRAIRAVGAGQNLLDPTITKGVLDRLRKGTDEPVKERLVRLSVQEERILGEVAGGKTNREIGVDLKLAEKTVKNYVSSILSKLEVARRADAAAYLARHTPPLA